MLAWVTPPDAWYMSDSVAFFKGDSRWSGGGLLASASSVISLSFSMACAPSTPSSVCICYTN